MWPGTSVPWLFSSPSILTNNRPEITLGLKSQPLSGQCRKNGNFESVFRKNKRVGAIRPITQHKENTMTIKSLFISLALCLLAACPSGGPAPEQLGGTKWELTIEPGSFVEFAEDGTWSGISLNNSDDRQGTWTLDGSTLTVPRGETNLTTTIDLSAGTFDLDGRSYKYVK